MARATVVARVSLLVRPIQSSSICAETIIA